MPPLKRVIQKYVQDPLAELILQCKIREGDTVKITSPSGRVVDATCKVWELGLPAEAPAL